MPGWIDVAPEPSARRIEASQSSFWMDFTDDIAIRVAPHGSGSRIDVRSLSRQGSGDFGVNAARVRAYIAALDKALAPAP
jgi:fatty-acyl-CoA synthase